MINELETRQELLEARQTEEVRAVEGVCAPGQSQTPDTVWLELGGNRRPMATVSVSSPAASAAGPPARSLAGVV